MHAMGNDNECGILFLVLWVYTRVMNITSDIKIIVRYTTFVLTVCFSYVLCDYVGSGVRVTNEGHLVVTL